MSEIDLEQLADEVHHEHRASCKKVTRGAPGTWTPERALQWQKEWREKNRSHINAYNRVRRSTNLNARAKDTASMLRMRARRKGWEFDLTDEWVEKRLAAGTCELTGKKFVFGSGSGKERLGAFAPSVDRKDPSKGYTQDNCQMILWCLNCAFGKWGRSITAEIVTAWLQREAKKT